MYPLLYLYQSALTVSGTQWHLLSSDVFLINAVFCGHNIAGINGSNCLLLNRWCSLLISGVVYKSAGDNYWDAILSTNPRCSLLICGVIYQSAGVNYWFADKKLKCPKQTQKGPKPKIFFARSSRYNDLTFYEKKFPLHNPFKYYILETCMLQIKYICIIIIGKLPPPTTMLNLKVTYHKNHNIFKC